MGISCLTVIVDLPNFKRERCEKWACSSCKCLVLSIFQIAYPKLVGKNYG